MAKAQSSPAYRLFSLEELKQATNNFNSSSFLGEGSKGKVLQESSVTFESSNDTFFFVLACIESLSEMDTLVVKASAI